MQKRESAERERKSSLRTTVITLVLGVVLTVSFLKWPISLDFTAAPFTREPLAAIVDTSFTAEGEPVSDTVRFGTTPQRGGETAAFCEVGGKLFKLGTVESSDSCSLKPVTIGGEGEYYVYSAALEYSGDTKLIQIGEDGVPVSLLEIAGVATNADLDGDGMDETVLETGAVKTCYVYEWEPEAGQARFASINAGLKKETVFFNPENNYFTPTFGGIGFLLDSFTYGNERLERHVRFNSGE
ncbi:MAG TPA: hypothetical protein VN369_09540 [Terriglobales bacterium]|nr:hypothetical protein [Terriglobales bacterium]